ncbi:adenylate kinase-domain-containing protein [Dichotomocladium elegans]|nr:adenylate kinase-domain-containing protein [Dichotomocladium elegans]
MAWRNQKMSTWGCSFSFSPAGDLLRAEQQREGSEYSELIQTYIQEGKIVPMEVTIALLYKAMQESFENDGKTRFLVDGFPRKMDQALKFEEMVVESRLVLYFEAAEQTLQERLLKRGESSGRVDDNIESIKKRFQTFKETSFPVIQYYEEKGKVRKINAELSREEVYSAVRQILDSEL